MKKVFILILLVFSFSIIFGCAESTPPSSWPRVLEKPKGPDKMSCETMQPGKTGNALSKIAYFLIDPIVTQVKTISLLVFDNIVKNPIYVNIIRVMILLYLIIYGITFTLGFVQAKVSDLIERLVKIGVLLTLATSTSYDFFNDYLFRLFTDGQYELLTIVTNPLCDKMSNQINFFAFFNYVIDTLFTTELFLRLTAMIFAFPIGWLCFIILLKFVIKYLFAVLQAIIAYLFAFTAIALLISLGPIFIALILFDKTREFFNNWMKAIIMFSLQPVLLFAAIFFITMFVNEALQNILVECNWKAFLSIYINFGTLGICPLFDLYWYVPFFISPFNFHSFLDFCASLMLLYLCVDLMGKLPAYIEQISFKLIGGQGVSIGQKGLISDAGDALSGVGQKVKGLAGMDKDSVERRKNWDKSAGKKEDESGGKKKDEKRKTIRKAS
jgi:type IV secretion system protein VirB6